MSYQAFVTDDANQPLAAAEPTNYEVIFRIYDSATGNTVIWAEKQTVSIFVGNFSVLLGNGGLVSGEPKPEDLADVFTAKERYMGITVGENAEFTPRQRIVPNAYAYRAKVAESVGGVISLDGTSTSLSGALDLTGNADFNGALDVDGHTNLDGFRSEGNGVINGTLSLTGEADFNGALDVDGYTHLDGFTSDGLATINSNLHVRHSINLDDRLNVDGNSLFKGHVDIRNNFYHGVDGAGHTHKIYGNTVGAFLNWNPHIPELQLLGSSKMYINNFLSVNGDTQLDGFRSDGNGTINGTLDVNGDTHLESSYHNGRITADGGLTVRMGSFNGVTNQLDAIQVNGRFRHVHSVHGYATGSDIKLKKNVQNLDDGALDKLLKLRPVTFELKKGPSYIPGRQTGFIAQEVEKIFPEWISDISLTQDGLADPDLYNFKTIGTRGFEALAVKALGELRTEKDAQIDALKEANSALETRLARLEALLGKQVKESN